MINFFRNCSFRFYMRCKAHAILAMIMNHVPLLEERYSELPSVVVRVGQAERVSYFGYLHRIHIWCDFEPIVAKEEVD